MNNPYDTAAPKLRDRMTQDRAFLRAFRVSPQQTIRSARWLSAVERATLLSVPADRLRTLCGCPADGDPSLPEYPHGGTPTPPVYLNSGTTRAPIYATPTADLIEPQPAPLTYATYAGYGLVNPMSDGGFYIITTQMIVPPLGGETPSSTFGGSVTWWIGLHGPTYSLSDGYLLQAGLQLDFDYANKQS